MAMIESGSWGPERLASSTPSIPDTARQGVYYGVVPQPRRALRLLDLVPTQVMDSKSFDYTREGGTMDADAAETVEGALKPGADMTLTDAQVVAKVIPAWIKLKRPQLADVPMLGTVTQNRLIYKINRRLENQIIGGDGVGENILGILNTSGIAAETFTSGDVLADDVSKGIRDVLLSDLEPNAAILNPGDTQKMWVAKSSGSREYLNGGPMVAPFATLFGLSVISSKVVAPGTALVGDFTNGLTLFIREAPNLRISDSDQDDFLRNQVTYLAELRAGVAIWNAGASAKVALAWT